MINALSRRAFISSTGALVVTLATADWAVAATSEAVAKPSLKPDQLDSYIAIEKDGRITAYYGKIDGGQGLGTSIAQMVAEEFDVPLERVHVVMGDTARTVNMGGASAATGVSRAGMNLRNMAAEARRLMVDMATKALGVPAERLTVSDGVIHEYDRQEQGHLLRRSDRQRTFRRAGEVERPAWARPCRDRAGEDQGSQGLQDYRQIAATPRSTGKGLRNLGDGT